MKRPRPDPVADRRLAARALLPLALLLAVSAPAQAAEKARGAGPADAAASAAESEDPLERIRQRLADKLGAAKAPQATGNVVQVPSKAPGDAPPPRRPRPPRAAEPPAAPPHPIHWSYAGEGGPARWGALQPEYATCASGQRQSPIDIRDGFAVDLEPVEFDYRPVGFSVTDNGHTVQVDVGRGNVIGVGGRRYELQQFHFHRPSEERIDGRQSEMVAHLVHRDPEGRLAVVAVLLERGAAQPVIQAIWNNLPLEKREPSRAAAPIDVAALLPADRGYYTYMGSLTTPPCTEGVLWIVLRTPVAVSPDQIDIFARLYPMNARPVQPSAGRMIKQSR